MSPLRNVLSDLVEKRLWPVALLLLGALVAVPLLLAKSPAPQPETPIAASAATAAAAHAEPAVRLVAEPARHAPLRGRAKDPFRQQHVPPQADTADGGGTPPVVETGTPSTAPSTPPAGSGSPGGSPGGTPAPPQKTYEVAAVDVRFGKATGPRHTHEDVPRLTPLPNAASPIVIFLGMRRDRETAVFLVSTDVHAQGEGRCVPSPKVCEAIELRRGQVAFLDFTKADDSVAQYELDLVDVTLHETTSEAEAERSYARVSRAGARLLRRRVRTSANIDGRPLRVPFRYVSRKGVLHVKPYASRRARATRARGAVTGGNAVDLAPAR